MSNKYRGTNYIEVVLGPIKTNLQTNTASLGTNYIEVVLGPIKTTTNKHKYSGISFIEVVLGPIKNPTTNKHKVSWYKLY